MAAVKPWRVVMSSQPSPGTSVTPGTRCKSRATALYPLRSAAPAMDATPDHNSATSKSRTTGADARALAIVMPKMQMLPASETLHDPTGSLGNACFAFDLPPMATQRGLTTRHRETPRPYDTLDALEHNNFHGSNGSCGEARQTQSNLDMNSIDIAVCSLKIAGPTHKTPFVSAAREALRASAACASSPS